MCQVTNKASLYSEKFQKDKLLVPGTPGTLVVYIYDTIRGKSGSYEIQITKYIVYLG
jgi:hypothetical protein